MRRNPYTKAQGLFSLSRWVLVNTPADTAVIAHVYTARQLVKTPAYLPLMLTTVCEATIISE